MPMPHNVVLDLDEFGSTAVIREAARLGVSPAELLVRAARYYLADRGTGRLSYRLPGFVLRLRVASGAGLAVELDDGAWSGLQAESARQGVALERLLEHAVLYLLADLDSGRAAARILAG